MINIALSVTLIAIFKAAFLRLFAARQISASQPNTPRAARLPQGVRSALKRSEANAH
jgi:ABC-type phosphate/phosphonate transport system permease subunit